MVVYSRSRRFAIGLILIIAAVFGFGQWLRYEHAEIARQDAERRIALNQKCFADVKKGQRDAHVLDGGLLPMLAGDAECVSIVDDLFFGTNKITADDARYVSQLVNVKRLGFYCTPGVEFVLENAQTLPIESVSYEGPPLSDESLRGFAKFSKLKGVSISYEANARQRAILQSLSPKVKVTIGE